MIEGMAFNEKVCLLDRVALVFPWVNGPLGVDQL